jgi:hypothetical protein
MTRVRSRPGATGAEPGFARAQPVGGMTAEPAKEGARGGTMGPPTFFIGGGRYARRLEKVKEIEEMQHA